jgi:hypothetical protein
MESSLGKSVFNELHRIEPRLLEYASVAPAGAIDVCEAVLKSQEDVRVRANALYLAFALDEKRGLTLAAVAMAAPESELRIASIRCLERAAPQVLSEAVSVVGRGLEDPDPGVRKFSLRLIEARRLSGLSSQVQKLAESDEFPHLRQLAKSVASRN